MAHPLLLAQLRTAAQIIQQLEPRNKMTRSVARMMLPYCIEAWRFDRSLGIVLNREYKPLGIMQYRPMLDYDSMGEYRIFTLSYDEFTREELINNYYLYDDGCPPWCSKADREQYIRRFDAAFLPIAKEIVSK